MALEGETYVRRVVPIEVHTDCKSLVDRVASMKMDIKLNKRRKMDVGDLQELVETGEMRPLVHIQGLENPADAMTHVKGSAKCKRTCLRLTKLMRSGWYEPCLG